ncbi:MAG: hypothetical protein JWR83_2859 [Aeromicrobium sp.]|nr:hypothetical protein [Aeromicrobium sp.]
MASQVIDWQLAQRLPAKDREILELSEQGMSQHEVGHHVGLSQGAVHYRLKKIAMRLDLLRQIPTFTAAEIRDETPMLSTSEQDVLFRYLRSNCQLEIARRMGRPQTSVRKMVGRIRDLLHEHGLTRYVDALDLLRANPALLRDWNESRQMGAALRGRTTA